MNNISTFIFFLLFLGFTFDLIIISKSEREIIRPPTQGNITTDDDKTRVPYCFRFTWVGPKYDTETKIKNLTCNDLLKGGKGIPCRRPLLATEPDPRTVPDTKILWDKYKKNPDKIACKMAGGDYCVKYSYVYNDKVENVTYMCAKVQIGGEPAASHGCYTQFRNGRKIEVCICESAPNQRPCNKGNTQFYQFNIVMIMMIVYLLLGSTILS